MSWQASLLAKANLTCASGHRRQTSRHRHLHAPPAALIAIITARGSPDLKRP